jgi:murein DD-endopeptidase MepM/ murein hydrolase activator NlpD
LFLLPSSFGHAGQDKAIDIRSRIRTQEKMVENFSKTEVNILDKLNAIDHTLNKARIKSQSLAKELVILEGKIGQLNRDRDQLIKKNVLTRKYAGKRLVALYKMNRIGRLDVVGQPLSVFDFFCQQNSMKRIITYDFKILDKQRSGLEKFEMMDRELKKEIKAKTMLEAKFNDQIKINKKQSLKKEILLKEIRQKKELSLAMVESMTHASRKLDSRITSIQKGKKSDPGKDSFSSYQGRLMIPADGEIISKFGPLRIGDYKSFTFQKGIDIKVKRGEPVKSVFKGKVMFAQWLKGYGNLLVIDHGKNYYTLYAHVEEIFKQKGETVKTGEVIATTGDTGSIKGACLHFEVRHHGKPVNPMKWLKKGA